MPDIADMPTRPALSATSDMPVVEPTPEPTETPSSPANPAPQVDGASGADDTLAASAPDDAASADEGGDGGEQTPEPPAQPRDGRQTLRQRLSEQSARARAAEAREARLAEMLERALARDAAQPAQQQRDPEPAPAPRPQREQFDDPDAYDTALIEWSAAVSSRAARQEAAREAQAAHEAEERQRQQDTQRQEQEQLAASWQERQAKLMEDPRYADWREVAANPDLEIPATVVPAILQADNGPAVLYHLGKNPAEASRIAKLNPLQAAIEIGRISATLAQPPAPPARKLPPPIEPVGTRAPAGPKSPDDMSMEEYAAMRNPQLAAQQRRGSVFGRAQ